MKYYISLTFLFFCTFLFSQKTKGTVTLIDGTILSGYVSVSNKVKFKSNLNAKAITYDYQNCKEASVIDKKGKEKKYEYIKLKENKKPILLEIITDGFLRLYYQDNTSYTGNFGGSGMGGFNSKSTYYVKKQTEDVAEKCAAFGYIGNSFKKFINDYFKDCQKLISKVENKEFKKKNLEEIVEFYNSNCH